MAFSDRDAEDGGSGRGNGDIDGSGRDISDDAADSDRVCDRVGVNGVQNGYEEENRDCDMCGDVALDVWDALSSE